MKKQIPLIAVGILSLFLSILLLPSKAEAQTYSEYYGLRISPRSYMPWNYDITTPMKSDTVRVSDKESYLRFSSVDIWPILFRRNQYLLLPDADIREAAVKVNYQATGDTISLSVMALDANGQPLGKHNLMLPASQTSGTLTLPLQGTEMLELALTVKMAPPAHFDLHGISLTLGGKDIDTFPLNLGAAPRIDHSQVQDGKVLLPDKPIIAIGENMHGTTTLNHTGIELIKERILNHNCRLVIFEYPPEFMLILNYYIGHEGWLEHPDAKIDWEVLDGDGRNFLQWVKEYNRTAQRKVVVAGMDNIDSLKEYLRRFFYLLSEKSGDSMLRNAASTGDIDDLVKTLNDSSEIWKHFTADEKFLIRHSVFQTQELEHRKRKRERGPIEWLRDSLMYENINAYYQRFCREGETTVIYSHYGHANKTARQNGPGDVKPMGQRLAERYKNDYYCLALWGGEGTRSHPLAGKTHYTTTRLSDFPSETFERQIDNGTALRWLPSSAFPDRIVLGGNSGNQATGYDFSFYNMRRGCDAVQFVRQVEPIPSYIDTAKARKEWIMKWFELIKERVAQEKKEE